MDLDQTTFGGISVLDLLRYSTTFVLCMVAFFNRQTRALNRLYYFWWGLFIVTWALAIFSPRSIETRIFVSLLLFSAAFSQLAITKLRKRASGER